MNMPIVNSSYSTGHLQVDGRRYVREVHILNTGLQKIIEYLAKANIDYNAVMLARVPIINAALAEDECWDNLRAIYSSETDGGAAVLTFNHISPTDCLTWLRGIYKSLVREQAGIIAGWILVNVTDAQLKNVFNITSGQLAALKTRLSNNYNAWLAIKNMAGE